MPKTLDVKCEKGHVERNRLYRHMEDDLGVCRFLIKEDDQTAVECGSPVVSIWNGIRHIEISGYFNDVTYNGLGDDVSFSSVRDMDDHLQKLRDEHHDQTLTYHFPSVQESTKKQRDARERYMERRRNEGVSERDLNRLRYDRLNRARP